MGIVGALTLWLVTAQTPASTSTCVDSEAAARIEAISQTLDAETHRLNVWSWTWGGIYASAAVAQLSVIPFVDHGARIDLTVGASSAAIGSTALFLLPLKVTHAAPRVRKLRENSHPCEALPIAEKEFSDAARNEQLSRGWTAHVGNVVFNLGLGAILGFGYGRWQSAAISAGVGTAIGATNIITQPHGLKDAEARYRTTLSWGIAPVSGPQMTGVVFVFPL